VAGRGEGRKAENQEVFHRISIDFSTDLWKTGGTVFWRATTRLHDLEERLWRLERDQKALQLEWESAYDKLRTLTARFVKRAEQIEKHDAMENLGNASPTGLSTVSPTLDPVSRRILERRARYFQPKEEKSA